MRLHLKNSCESMQNLMVLTCFMLMFKDNMECEKLVEVRFYILALPQAPRNSGGRYAECSP